MSTSEKDIADHEASGQWRSLMMIAERCVADAEAAAGSSMRPLFGGGTRLMLSLHHRISDDIDLFIRDPQWIGYLTPRLSDSVAAVVDGYEENAVSLKLRVESGEIDFIVAMSLLNESPQRIAGIAFELEPIAEVLAKKLFYRGSMLTPRDLFDWWAIETMAPQEVSKQRLAKLLKDRLGGIELALNAMRGSNAAANVWGALRAPRRPTLEEAVDFGLNQLAEYRWETVS